MRGVHPVSAAIKRDVHLTAVGFGSHRSKLGPRQRRLGIPRVILLLVIWRLLLDTQLARLLDQPESSAQLENQGLDNKTGDVNYSGCAVSQHQGRPAIKRLESLRKDEGRTLLGVKLIHCAQAV
jgi:hypothetical protein